MITKDTVEQFLKDESFCMLPTIMLQCGDISLDSNRSTSNKLQYKKMVFWVEDNQLQIQTYTTRYVKDLQDVLNFPMEFKAIQFFDSLEK